MHRGKAVTEFYIINIFSMWEEIIIRKVEFTHKHIHTMFEMFYGVVENGKLSFVL